jgi:hypothetical protein
MLAKVYSCAILGLDGQIIEVETDKGGGAPKFMMVGLPDTAVQESRVRVRAAIRNSGLGFPTGLYTVNLAPADLPEVELGEPNLSPPQAPDLELTDLTSPKTDLDVSDFLPVEVPDIDQTPPDLLPNPVPDTPHEAPEVPEVLQPQHPHRATRAPEEDLEGNAEPPQVGGLTP